MVIVVNSGNLTFVRTVVSVTRQAGRVRVHHDPRDGQRLHPHRLP